MDGYKTVFNFAPDGTCTIDYSHDGDSLKKLPCTYTMGNGSATVDYAYNWRTFNANKPQHDAVWYEVRLTPIEGGRALIMQPVEGTFQTRHPMGAITSRTKNLKSEKAVRFERIR